MEPDDLKRLASYLYAAVEAGRATKDDWQRWADRMIEEGVTSDWILGLRLAKSTDQAISLLVWAGPLDRDVAIGHKWILYYDGEITLRQFLQYAHDCALEADDELAVHSSVFSRGIESLDRNASETDAIRIVETFVHPLSVEAERQWRELFPPAYAMRLDESERGFAFQDPPFQLEIDIRIFVDVDHPLDVEAHRQAALDSVPKDLPFVRSRYPRSFGDAIPTRIDRKTFLGPSYDLASRRLIIRDGCVASTFEGFAHAYCTAPYRPPIDERIVQEHFERVLTEDLKLTDETVIYSWPTDWASYFEAGHEWWGSFLWTLGNPGDDRIVVLMASATD